MTPKTFLRSLTLIHAALLFGPLLLGVFLYTTTEMAVANPSKPTDYLTFIFPVLGLAGFFAGKFFYQKSLQKIRTMPVLSQKLTAFRSAALIQYALLEGPALINLVAFGQTGNFLFLTVGGALLLYLWTMRPHTEKIKRDLALRGEHLQQFEKTNEPL